MRYLIAMAIISCGLMVVFQSANLSFQGYEKEFPGLFGAGFIGVAFSGLAFFSAGAIAIAIKQSAPKVAALALAMAVLFSCADAFGNWLATHGEVEDQAAATSEETAAFDTAFEALPITRERIAAAERELEIVTGPDLFAAQRLLKGKGYYTGEIDGKFGKLTDDAIADFGASLRANLADWRQQEASQMKAVADGRPQQMRGGEAAQATLIAILLTVSSFLASFLGNSIMPGESVEDEIEALEDGVSDLEAEVYDLARYLHIQQRE